MRLSYYRGNGTHTNFGDELTPLLFNALQVPFDNGPGVISSIGTVLHAANQPVFDERPLIVFGSGAGFGNPPDISGGEVRFVRGPKTARLYDYRHKWLTDPAILVARLDIPKIQDIEVGFMPHWLTIEGDGKDLSDAMRSSGIQLIDPRRPARDVLFQIGRTRLLITEALHGAVVADALRIPWIPVYIQNGHLFKWLDWTQSMELPYDPSFLSVSNVRWIVDNVDPFLSSDLVHSSKLLSVSQEIRWLKNRLKG